MSSKIGETAIESGHGLHDGEARRRSRRLAPGVIGVCLVMVLASSLALVLVPGARAAPGPPYATVKVPCEASIQTAINAAHPGDTIVLAKCTYIEQLTITKSITIIGAGAGKTIIQSPANVKPDAFGNPWTIEIGNAATVTMSGFTLFVTLQCLVAAPAGGISSQPAYVSGGIGVGGSAYLTLQSAVLTTASDTEGASCNGGAGLMSYGTGIGFGIDYVTGTPAASQLVGDGAVSGVTISGFGFGGPSVAVGGIVDSPAGSYASLSNDRIATGTNPVSPFVIGVGAGMSGSAGSFSLVSSVVTAGVGTFGSLVVLAAGSSAYVAHDSITGTGSGNGVTVYGGSTATITYNSIGVAQAGPGFIGVEVEAGSFATITHNVIMGPAPGEGIAMGFLGPASAVIEYNLISEFACANYAPWVEEGKCGLSFAYQYGIPAIFDIADAGLGTVIEHNVISSSDEGIALYAGCPACVEGWNVVLNSNYYGLIGSDGTYTFSHDLVIGGAYGVGAAAVSVDTTVTLDHVVIVSPSVGPFYYEVDFSGGTATIGGTWWVV
jgi:hypothetical protein